MENYPACLYNSDCLLNNLTRTPESDHRVNSLEILALLLGFIPYFLSEKIMAGAHLNMKALSLTTSESRRAVKLGVDQTTLNVKVTEWRGHVEERSKTNIYLSSTMQHLFY